MVNTKDIVGNVYSRLTVVSRAEDVKNTHYWLCECQCGNEKTIRGSNLKSGLSTSCGCFAKEAVSKVRTTHGLSTSKISAVWYAMVHRCTNPKNKSYIDYGNRGIDMCSEWANSMETFMEWAKNSGYKEKLTIERIDNNGGYNPGNCTWATRQEQAVNKRVYKNSSSGYVGITLVKKTGKWSSVLKHEGKLVASDRFVKLKDAVAHRNEWILFFKLPYKIQEYVD